MAKQSKARKGARTPRKVSIDNVTTGATRKRVRRNSPTRATRLVVGSIIEQEFLVEGVSTFFKGKVTKVRQQIGETVYKIEYDDGDKNDLKESKLLALVKANQVRILSGEEGEEASALDDENESASEESNGEEPHSGNEYIPPEQGEEEDVFDFQPEQEEGEEEVSTATASQTVRPRANCSVSTPVGTQYSYIRKSYSPYFYIVRQLIQDEHMDRCYICNQNMNTLEYVIVVTCSSKLGIFIHGYPRNAKTVKIHPQCFTQIATLRKGFMVDSHINFLKSGLVRILNEDNRLVPLCTIKPEFDKIVKIFEKHFYADEEFCRNVPKYSLDEYIESGNQIEGDEESGDDVSLGNESDGVSQENNEDLEDKWDLQHIFTIEEITRTDPLPQECMTKSCPLPACTKYVQHVDQTNIWYSCLDCQEQDFGGWPEELNEYPVNFLTVEHCNIMKDLCTDQNSITMPNIPINENGDFANERAIEDMFEGKDIYPPEKNSTLRLENGNEVEFKGTIAQKWNEENDDIFFCQYGSTGKKGSCFGYHVPLNIEDVTNNQLDCYRLQCSVCSRRGKDAYMFMCKQCNKPYKREFEDHKCNHEKIDVTPAIMEEYSVDMTDNDLRQVLQTLVSSPDSILYKLLKKNTFFEIGCSADGTTQRLRSKLALTSSSTSGLFKRLNTENHFVSTHGIAINFQNVQFAEDGDPKFVAEKWFYEELVQENHGICLSLPYYFSNGIKRSIQNGNFKLYIIGALPRHNYKTKYSIVKGRTSTQREAEAFQELEASEERERNKSTHANVLKLLSLMQAQSRNSDDNSNGNDDDVDEADESSVSDMN